MSNKIHIYSQSFWHTPSYIVGNTKALVGIRDAINKALDRRHGVFHDAMTSDGEGYDIHVLRVENCDPRWEDLMYPYSDEIAAVDFRGNSPHTLLKYSSKPPNSKPCPDCGSTNPILHWYHEPKPGEES